MKRNVIIRTIERADPATVSGLGAAGVATVHEAQGRTGLMDPGIRPIQRGSRVGGPAVTVSSHPGDNMMIHAAVEMVQPGDIVVVSTTSPSSDGMFGELLATSLHAHGCGGLVIDAGVRDVAELNEMGFPVWTRAIHAQGTVKATAGSVNVPIVCGGTGVAPGDVIVADDDGVVVVPRLDAPAALEAAATRLATEEKTRERLAAGELGVDFYGLRERLIELGAEYLDSAEEL